MSKLIDENVFKLPPIKPIDTSKPLPSCHDTEAFFQFHRQPSHDNENYTLRSRIQDFIDSNAISVAGVNDKGTNPLLLLIKTSKPLLILCLPILLMWLGLNLLHILSMTLVLSPIMF